MLGWITAVLVVALAGAIASVEPASAHAGYHYDTPTEAVAAAHKVATTSTTPTVNTHVAAHPTRSSTRTVVGPVRLVSGFVRAAKGEGALSRLGSRLADETGSIRPPARTPWGWTGTKAYRDAVGEIDAGGTLKEVGGHVPTQAQAEMLIEDAGGVIQRIEGPHLPPNPHQYPHINYTTSSGQRGTVRIGG